MVIKVYISGISGNKEVKKHQQRVLMILDSKNIDYVTVDITEPGKEDEKELMQQKSNPKDAKHPLPPQLFNDENYCGDYEDFDLANEVDELEKFLKLTSSVSKSEIILNTNNVTEEKREEVSINGISSSREASVETEDGVRREGAQDSAHEVDGDTTDEVVILN
ncbi:SH3 domain-binding glutamic acid-rich protein homolog [Bacillus rossius redtenbacheri]|uniref:SH3 domain-binding glutamic acid-rich protein homolog n=1 Tax=Bacillus rossius redtenbacheri TaxID=93214 RepID=UPI002FDE9EBB